MWYILYYIYVFFLIKLLSKEIFLHFLWLNASVNTEFLFFEAQIQTQLLLKKSYENFWIKIIPTSRDLKFSSMQAYKIFHT